MEILKAGLLYFAIVFGAGFVLGPIRILLVVPRLGDITAELLEAPIMLVVIILASQWVIQYLSVPFTFSSRLGMGFLGLGLMVAAEFTFVLWIRGISVKEYLKSRDRISGMVYYVMLVVFAVMPTILGRQ
jgi:hypothetical protein